MCRRCGRHTGRTRPAHAASSSILTDPAEPVPGPLPARPGGLGGVPASPPGQRSRSAGSNSRSAHRRNSPWVCPPICTTATSVKPPCRYCRTACTCAARSGPHGMDRNVVLGDEPGGGLERRGAGQFGVHLPAAAEPAEGVVCAVDGVGTGRSPADGDLADAWPAAAAHAVEAFDQAGVRLHRDERVGMPGGQGAGRRAGGGDADAGRRIRQVPQLGRVHPEVPARDSHVAAAEQPCSHGSPR